MLPGGHRHRGHGGNADARFHHPQHRGDGGFRRCSAAPASRCASSPVKQRPVAGDPIQANIILFKIRLPAWVRLARQRMIVPTGGHIAVVGKRGEFGYWLAGFWQAEAKVSLSAADRLDHIPDAAVNQPDAHLGITRLKAADDFRHKVVGGEALSPPSPPARCAPC